MRLEINGYEADYEGKIAITRQTFNADNPSIRLIDISNKIVLPKSDKNKKIFSDNLDANNLDELYTAKIIDQYYIFNGTGTLTSAGDEWKFQLTDKSKVLFDDLKQKLNELDLESDDFNYGSTSYNILKEKTDSVWIYPIVQMHESELATDLNYLRPHFRMSNLLQHIFTSRNYSLNYDTDLIDSLGIQANSKDFNFTSYQKTLNGATIGDLTINDFNYDVIVLSTIINVDVNKTAFRLRGYVTSVGESKITFNNDEIILNNGTHYYDETTSELEGAVTITLTGSVTFTDTLLYTIIKERSFDDLSSFIPAGFKVKVYDNLPDITQSDLFKDSLILTNSIIVPDNLKGEINIKSLNSLNPQNKVDWSDKFIDKSESIRSNINGLSKKNMLVYENGVGDSFFNTDIEYLQNENDYIKLRYSGSPDKEDYAVYNTYEVDSDGNNVRNRDNYLRIVYVDGYYGKFTPINWSNLVLNYYSTYFNSLNKPREITAQFNLKKLDVVGFDGLVLVYIEKFNSNFIVESIENFISGELTKIKLLRYGR